MPVIVNYALSPKKRYGFWHFMGDLFLTALTGGLWLIWLIFKALAK